MPQFCPSYARLKQRGSQTTAKTLLLEREYRRPIIEKSIFLSHKSEDDELVAGTLLVLEDNGATVYVDHKDRSLDGASGVAVAGHLRKVIGLCAKLVMLATPAAAHSKWIPWELGFADGQKQDRNVALFPVATLSPDMGWAEQEYLGLYQRIALTSSSAVTQDGLCGDHIHKKGMSLRDWISRPA